MAGSPDFGNGMPSTGGPETGSRTWDQLIDELLGIRNLKDDWDGEGTEAPPPALVDGAIKTPKSTGTLSSPS
jgi:hypothetical protein